VGVSAHASGTRGRSPALVGPLIDLLTTLAIQPATAAAQSISHWSGARHLISDGGFESEQSAWTSVESPHRTSQRAHCGCWVNEFWLAWQRLGLSRSDGFLQRRGALILSTGRSRSPRATGSCVLRSTGATRPSNNPVQRPRCDARWSDLRHRRYAGGLYILERTQACFRRRRRRAVRHQPPGFSKPSGNGFARSSQGDAVQSRSNDILSRLPRILSSPPSAFKAKRGASPRSGCTR
jgi:hypothetical protein